MSNDAIEPYISNRGYAIPKDCLDVKDQILLRKDLSVQPYVPKNSFIKPSSFPVYRESHKKFYIPKFYGTDVYGAVEKNKLSDGIPIDLEFNGQLREHQIIAVETYMKAAREVGGGLLELHTGFGKTILSLYIISRLKTKTLIIVHKEFLLRQWIERIEQFLPQANVGRIQQNKIETDGKHIVIAMLQSLSMKDYPIEMFAEYGLTIVDECFPYQQMIHTSDGMIRIGTLYNYWKNKKPLPDILSFNISNNKFEYKKMTYAWQKENNELIKIKMSKRIIKCTKNHKILTDKGYVKACDLKINDLIMAKYDENHKDNIISKALNDDQKQVIYGSYLGDGHIRTTKKNRYRLTIIHCENQKNYCKWKASMFNISELEEIEKNGYSQKKAYRFNTKIFDFKNVFPTNTKIIPSFILDEIDERGIAVWYMDDGSINVRKLKNNKTSYHIRIHSNNFDYDTHLNLKEMFMYKYDIEVNIRKQKNKYYYLDFNKENSEKLIKLIYPYIHISMIYKIPSLYADTKYNWNNNFMNYGYLKVNEIEYINNSEPVYDIEVEDNHNFILATKYTNKKLNNYIDGPIVSNCHHISSEVFSRALFKVVTKYTLGLSATMKRKDGLTKVIKWFLGDIVFTKQRKGENKVLVKAITYESNDEEFDKDIYDYRGQIKYTSMIKKLCEFNRRSEFMLKVLKDLVDKRSDDEQIMVLAHNKNLLKYLHDAIEHRNIATVGYYVGGMKEIDLKISESKKIIIATYAMAEEGLDIKTLTTLLMATPKVDVNQAVGRILRRKDHEALVIDIIDVHNTFQRHWKKRKTFYRKQKFKVIHTTSSKYDENKWETVIDDGKFFKSPKPKNTVENMLLQGKCLC